MAIVHSIPSAPNWARSTRDRDFVPSGGESSRQAGERLRVFLAELPTGPAPVAVVTHGGVTTDPLRTLLGDRSLPPGLLDTGIPSCAITMVSHLNVVAIASTEHLAV